MFNVRNVGPRPETRGGRKYDFILEGTYNKPGFKNTGVYHLIRIDPNLIKASFVMPHQFHNPEFLKGYSPRLVWGGLTDAVGEMRNDQDIVDLSKRAAKRFMSVGAERIRQLMAESGTCFITDATNAPFNEGHFALLNGQLLPLAQGAGPYTGQHYIMRFSDGEISFRLLNLEDIAAVRSVKAGFFVPRIVHNGKPIGLLDKVPGTDKLLISDFRGHIGQLFKEKDYADAANDPYKLKKVNSELIEYLRDPEKYYEIVSRIVNGEAVDIGGYKDVKFELNSYAINYCLETDQGLYFLKVYPSPEIGTPGGFTIPESAAFLKEVGGEHGFSVTNAHIGTNGKDVRILIPDENNQPVAISKRLDGQSLGDYFNDRLLANGICFSWTPETEDLKLRGFSEV